jgi:fucose 4-O-acetylase-like acetyltransferase
LTGARTRWLDSARGAGVILVVIGHVERGLTDAGIAASEAFEGFDLALYTFHMPLFFLLAGVNSGRSIDQPWFVLLRRKIVTIVYPYALWSLVQGSVVAVMAQSTNGEHHWRDLLYIGWRPIGQFWFLYALFLYTMGAASVRHNAVLILIMGTIAVLAADRAHPGSPIALGLHHMIFFGVGMAFSQRIIAWRPSHAVWVAGLSGAAWGFGWQVLPHGHRFAYLAASALPCAFTGSVFVMAIFVLHILAASGVRIALVLADVPVSTTQHIIIGTLCGVAFPCAVQAVAQHLRIARALALRA